jgi:hypothetical protein
VVARTQDEALVLRRQASGGAQQPVVLAAIAARQRVYQYPFAGGSFLPRKHPVDGPRKVRITVVELVFLM